MNLTSVAACATLLIVMVFVGALITSLFLNPISVQATVTNVTTYDADTIQDGQTYNVIGYNMTFTYHGLTGHDQVLCPLYPVGSKVQVGYGNFLWLHAGIGSLYNLPQGCQTNSGF